MADRMLLLRSMMALLVLFFFLFTLVIFVLVAIMFLASDVAKSREAEFEAFCSILRSIGLVVDHCLLLFTMLIVILVPSILTSMFAIKVLGGLYEKLYNMMAIESSK